MKQAFSVEELADLVQTGGAKLVMTVTWNNPLHTFGK